jgi:hypothetical protein
MAMILFHEFLFLYSYYDVIPVLLLKIIGLIS